MRRVWLLLAAFVVGCGSGPLPTESPPNHAGPRPQPVTIFYDQNGQPNLTFFSASATMTVSGARPTLNRPDLYATRTFGETYSWQSGQDWAASLSFATNPSAFSSAPAPLYDVSLASMNFVTRASDLRLRSGAQYPLPPASVTVYTPTGTSTQYPAPIPVAPASAEPATQPTTADRRTAFSQAHLVSPGGAEKTLDQLRSRFTETRQGNRSVFRRQSGDYAAEVTYDHDEGLIKSSTSFVKGRRAFATAFAYADTLGLKLLRSETTVFYDANGRETHRTSRTLSDVRFETEKEN